MSDLRLESQSIILCNVHYFAENVVKTRKHQLARLRINLFLPGFSLRTYVQAFKARIHIKSHERHSKFVLSDLLMITTSERPIRSSSKCINQQLNPSGFVKSSHIEKDNHSAQTASKSAINNKVDFS